MTSLTASIPKPLKDSLAALAKAEKRSLSNFLVVELEKIVEEKTATAGSQPSEKKEDATPRRASSLGSPALPPSRRSSFPPTASGLNEPEGEYPAKKKDKK